MDNPYSSDFWEAIKRLLSDSEVVIDRAKGSEHPRFSHLIYPLDYGYLKNTTSMDGDGIDLWRGSGSPSALCGIVVTVDLMKRDSEIKILLGCTEDEIAAILAFHNNSEWMKALFIPHEIQ